jgi:hypothetical protein
METRTKLDAALDTLRSPGLLDSDAASSSSEAEHSSSVRGGSVPSASLPRLIGPSSDAELPCLSEDMILEYRQGNLSRVALERLDAHLDACSACRELVEMVIADEPDALASPSQVTTFHRGFLAAGRYEIADFVGRGGMGEVYAAIDQLTGKRVALKTVVCTATDDARAVRKLFDEVLNAQRVAHPHVFRIYDLHEHRDALRGLVPFFTMEFIEGESLGKRLRRAGALPVAEVAVIARQLLAGLSAAHARGVLHLDLKSDNVMLRGPGVAPDAVIMDFGLSRAPDLQSQQRTSERLQGAGTLPYMSIEQLECRADLGPASDVYSFGVVLYEMLTGQLPFRGASFAAVLLKQIRERPIPASRYVPSLSRSVDKFIFSCLSRSDRDRPANAARALDALEAITSWQAPERPSRLRRAASVLALLTMAALCWAVLQWGAGHWATRAPRPLSSKRALQGAPGLAAPGISEAAQPAPTALPETSPGVVSDPAPPAGGSPRTVVAPPTTARKVRPRAPEPRERTPLVEPLAQPPGASPPSAAPGWRGPPPQHVPRPRPL